MTDEPIFLDTVYIQGILNRHDQHHLAARRVLPLTRQSSRLWVTEAVLVEVANALASIDRAAAAKFALECYRATNLEVVPVDTATMRLAIDLYRDRPDQQWGLTDCISFVVMTQNGIRSAATADRHFVQAGFRALMLEAG